MAFPASRISGVAFCASGFVPPVCCWVNHVAAGSRLLVVFHSSSEIFGQE
jgi:hypothetical protein